MNRVSNQFRGNVPEVKSMADVQKLLANWRKELEDLYEKLGSGKIIGGSLSIAGVSKLDGPVIIDVNDIEALLVRKDGDAGDIFSIDTINTRMTFNDTPASSHSIKLTALSGGAGTGDAGKKVDLKSGVGGSDTTGPGSQGGAGGTFGIFIGSGGAASGDDVALNIGGDAGDFAFSGGSGGSASNGLGAAVGNTGGDGTTISFTSGGGGSATGSNNQNDGGGGGDIGFTAGSGGASTSGSNRTGGDGGDINFTPGLGGTTSGGTDGAEGVITFGDGGVTNFTQISRIGDIVQAGAGRTHESLKFKLTAIGGYAIMLTNKTGGNTVAGQLVVASTGTDDAFATAGASSDAVIGIVLDAGVADGSEAWIVESGIADTLIDAGGCAHGDRMISSATAGSADVWNVGGAVATHFLEIGHCLETRIGAGLARVKLHFN